jgi:hypothetical protein
MKRFSKTPVILSLIFTVFIFSIYCCCFPAPVQAKNETPSCHQTGQTPEQPSHSQGCDCHKIAAAYHPAEKDAGLYLAESMSSFFLTFFIPAWDAPVVSLNFTVPKSSSVFASIVPLYIQNAILRI